MFNRKDNTWEPEANLGSALIEGFETNRKKEMETEDRAKKEPQSTTIPAVESSKKKQMKEVEKENIPRGFDRGLVAEEIINALYSSGKPGELMFLIKWLVDVAVKAYFYDY